ncbi:hypothetical protein OCU04_003978 [Sclerotinia nivalis]|uniref:Uncharacterized protein n=1 Tax=Sclerotinia nivalis TaxID=352851 RepID=A0A9X0AT16_9HELO|nr:hypothetical protein OCU04_003978 [Sclerotinia nivalis]
MSEFPKFHLLATELQDQIIEECASADILRLAQTSHGMCDIALPLLYRHVDISCHNERGLFQSIFGSSYGKVLADNPYREMAGKKELGRRQSTFCNAIIKKPSLGSWVLSLTWTCNWSCWEGVTDLEELNQKVWNAWMLLVRVQKLDLCSLAADIHVLEFSILLKMIPPSIFPMATTIKIGCNMPYSYFRACLSSPETVISLELNNLLGVRQFKDGWSLFRSGRKSDIKEEEFRCHPTRSQETVDENGIPVLRHDGPMRGHLQPFLGRFTKLAHLTIRTIGHEDHQDHRWSEVREKARYTEIATFIKSVAPTLTTLVFEQGMEVEGVTGRSSRAQSIKQTGRPMDTYFLSHILPALTEEQWPKLEKLSIRGVGGEIRDSTRVYGRVNWTPETSGISESAEDQLRLALGNSVRFSWEKMARKSFHMMVVFYGR